LKSLTPELTAHIAQDLTTLAVCWRVTRTDGVMILGTEHDRDIEIGLDSPSHPYTGTYLARAGITGSNVRSSSDMSVDNLEIEGAVNNGDLSLVDLSAADIEAGLLDDADVVLFLVNWEAPDDGQIVLRTGTLGEIHRTAEGQYRTELRGLAQKLTQQLLRTYGPSCDAELGDTRCGISLGALTVTGVVTAVTSNRAFSATIASGSPQTSCALTLYLPMPYDIEVGDTFTIRPGCDKSAVMCKERFANLVNFRGHGFWVPGTAAITQFGGQTPATDPAVGSTYERIRDIRVATLAEERPELPADPDELPDAWLAADSAYYEGGLVTWTSGENETFSMEVKRQL
jgi:hypothetical protein